MAPGPIHYQAYSIARAHEISPAMSVKGEWTVRIKIGACLCLVAGALAAIDAGTIYAQLSSNATVFASGLNGPRGLKFGPDGTLYVAEAGSGGTTSTVGQCEQVPPPVGPYLGGNTARISKVDRFGTVSTVVSGLPSSVSPIGD